MKPRTRFINSTFVCAALFLFAIACALGKQTLSSYGTTALVQGKLNVLGVFTVGGNSNISSGFTNNSGYTQVGASANTFTGVTTTAGITNTTTALLNSAAYTQSGTNANTFTGASTFSAAATGLAITNNETVGGTLLVTGVTTATGGITNNGSRIFGNQPFTATGTISATGAGIALITGTTAAQTLTLPLAPPIGTKITVINDSNQSWTIAPNTSAAINSTVVAAGTATNTAGSITMGTLTMCDYIYSATNIWQCK